MVTRGGRAKDGDFNPREKKWKAKREKKKAEKGDRRKRIDGYQQDTIQAIRIKGNTGNRPGLPTWEEQKRLRVTKKGNKTQRGRSLKKGLGTKNLLSKKKKNKREEDFEANKTLL